MDDIVIKGFKILENQKKTCSLISTDLLLCITYHGSQVSQEITVLLSQTEKEVIPRDSSHCSSKTPHGHIPSSFPGHITKVGGELSAPLKSDIHIVVPSSAIPTGTNQDVFFRVSPEEKILLRYIPEPPSKTLISPVVECGPHDIHLLK